MHRLKGEKAGSEQSCGCPAQPGAAAPSFHHTKPRRLVKGRTAAGLQDKEV